MSELLLADFRGTTATDYSTEMNELKADKAVISVPRCESSLIWWVNPALLAFSCQTNWLPFNLTLYWSCVERTGFHHDELWSRLPSTAHRSALTPFGYHALLMHVWIHWSVQRDAHVHLNKMWHKAVMKDQFRLQALIISLHNILLVVISLQVRAIKEYYQEITQL